MNQEQRNPLNLYTLCGFAISVFSLFLVITPLLPLVGVILSFLGLSKTSVEDKRGKLFGFLGIGCGLITLVYVYFQMQ